jgi:diadenosine tetraphosphate (Ap4A) HIT family hydrolase
MNKFIFRKNINFFKANKNKKSFSTTIFDKIINKEINSEIVYEDDHVLAFKDVNPAAPIHLLIIPKKKDGLTGVSKAEEKHIEILGKLMLAAKKIGDKLNLKDGYRLVINEGSVGCQSIFHLHIHFLSGRQFGWPPGTDNQNIKQKYNNSDNKI